MSTPVHIQTEPIREIKTVGYRWSLTVNRKKFKPAPNVAYKGDTEEVQVSVGGNTDTLEQMWTELYHAARNLGVKVNE